MQGGQEATAAGSQAGASSAEAGSTSQAPHEASALSESDVAPPVFRSHAARQKAEMEARQVSEMIMERKESWRLPSDHPEADVMSAIEAGHELDDVGGIVEAAGAGGDDAAPVESLLAPRSERQGGPGVEGGSAGASSGDGAQAEAPPPRPPAIQAPHPPGPVSGSDGEEEQDAEAAAAAAKAKEEARILRILETPPRARGSHEVDFLAKYLRAKAPKLFADMPGEAVRTVARRATLHVSRPQEVLFTQGEKGDKYFLILRGQVDIHVATGNQAISALTRATREYADHVVEYTSRVERVSARRAAARVRAQRQALLGRKEASSEEAEAAAAEEEAAAQRSRRADALSSGMSDKDAALREEAHRYPPLLFTMADARTYPPGVAREGIVVRSEAAKRHDENAAKAQDSLYEQIAAQQAAQMMKRAAGGGGGDAERELELTTQAALALASQLNRKRLVGKITTAVTKGSQTPAAYRGVDFFQLLGSKLGYNNVHDKECPLRVPMTVQAKDLGNVVVTLPPGAGFGEIALLGAAQGMKPPPGQDDFTPAQKAEIEKLSKRNASAVCVGSKGFDAELGRVVGDDVQEAEDVAEARASPTGRGPGSPVRNAAGAAPGDFSKDAMFGAHPDDDRDKKSILRGLTYLLVIDKETYLESLTEKARQELDVKMQFLRHGMGLPLFTDWPTRRLTTIAYALKEKAFPLRAPIFTRGSPVKGVYFIVTGFVRVTAYAKRKAPPQGLAKTLGTSTKGMGSARSRVHQFALTNQRLPVSVVTLGPGSVVGDLGPKGVLPDARHTTSAVAESSTVTTFFLPQHDFLNLVMRQTDTWVAARLAAEGQRRMQGQRSAMASLGLSADILASLTPSQRSALGGPAEGVAAPEPYAFGYGDGNEYWETLQGVGSNRNVKFQADPKPAEDGLPPGILRDSTASAPRKAPRKPRKAKDALTQSILDAKRAKRQAAEAAAQAAQRAESFAAVSSLQMEGKAGTSHGDALVGEWHSRTAARRERAIARQRAAKVQADRAAVRKVARQRGQELQESASAGELRAAQEASMKLLAKMEADVGDDDHEADAWLRATAGRQLAGSSTRFAVPVLAEGLASAAYATLQASDKGRQRQDFTVTPCMALSSAGQAAKPVTMVGGALRVSLPPSRLRSAASLPHLIMGSATALPLPLPPPPPKGMPPPTVLERADMPLLRISDALDSARTSHVSALRRLAQTTGADGGPLGVPLSARTARGMRLGAGGGYRRAITPPGRWPGRRGSSGAMAGGMVGSFALSAALRQIGSPSSSPASAASPDGASPRSMPDPEVFAAARAEVLARAAAATSGGDVVFSTPVPVAAEKAGPRALSPGALAQHDAGQGAMAATFAAGSVPFSASSVPLVPRGEEGARASSAPSTTREAQALPPSTSHKAFLPREVRDTLTSVERGHGPLGAAVTINTAAVSPLAHTGHSPVRQRAGGQGSPHASTPASRSRPRLPPAGAREVGESKASVTSLPMPLQGRLLTDGTTTTVERVKYYHETGAAHGALPPSLEGIAHRQALAHRPAAPSARDISVASTASLRLGSPPVSGRVSAASSAGAVHNHVDTKPIIGSTRRGGKVGGAGAFGRLGSSSGRGGGRVGGGGGLIDRLLSHKDVANMDPAEIAEALRYDAPQHVIARYAEVGRRRKQAVEGGAASGHPGATRPSSTFVSAGSRVLSKEALGTGFAGGGGVGPGTGKGVTAGGRAAVLDTLRSEYEDVSWRQAAGREPITPRVGAAGKHGKPPSTAEAGSRMPAAPSLVDAAAAHSGSGVGSKAGQRGKRHAGPIPPWMQLMAASGHKQRALRDVTVAEAAGVEIGSGKDPLITQSGVASRALAIQQEKDAIRRLAAVRAGELPDRVGMEGPIVPSEAGGIIAAGAQRRPDWEDESRPWRQGAVIEARVRAALAGQEGPNATQGAPLVRPPSSARPATRSSSGLSGRTQHVYNSARGVTAKHAGPAAPSAPTRRKGVLGKQQRAAVLRGKGRRLKPAAFATQERKASTPDELERAESHQASVSGGVEAPARFEVRDAHAAGPGEGEDLHFANEYAAAIAASSMKPRWSVSSLGALGQLAQRASEERWSKQTQAAEAERLSEAVLGSADTAPGAAHGAAGGLQVTHRGLQRAGTSAVTFASARGLGSTGTLGGSFATMPNSGASSARLGSGGASSSRFMQSMPKHVFADWAGAGVGRSSVPSLALPSEQSSKSQAEESPQLQGEALLDRGFGAEAAAAPVPPPRTATDTPTASTQQTSEGDGPADEDGDAVAELPQSPIGGVEGGVHPPPSVTPTAAAPSVMVHAPWQGAAVQDAPKRTAGKVTGAPLLPPPPTGMQRPAVSASSIAQFTSAAASTSDVVETEARHTAGSAGAHVPDATGFGVAAPAVSVGVSPMRSRSGTASSLDSGEGSTGSPTARSRRRHLSRHAQKSHQYTTAEQKMERAALPLMLPSAVNGKLVAAPAAAAVPDAPEAAPSTPTPAPPTLVTTEPVRTTTVESAGGLGDGELAGPLPPVHSPMGRAGRQSTTGSDVFSELSDEEAAGHTGEPATPAQSQPRSALGTPASVLGGRHSAMESPAGAAIDMPTQSP